MKNDKRKKSSRQRKIDKHANVTKTKRKFRFLALAVTALILTIPFYFKYLHS